MSIEVASIKTGGKVSIRGLKRKAEKILEILKQNCSELSIALVGNREIQELNAGYRKKNEPTDVLSFPSGETLPTGMRILGDVVISVEQAEKQAGERGKTLMEEMESLLIHGILHLLGYDHERSQKDARVMRGMEKKISRALCGTKDLRV